MTLKFFIVVTVLLLIETTYHIKAYEVVYAINSGGKEHLSSDGILYQKDPLEIGTASDYGKNLLGIARAPDNDQTLYQTERYHTSTFGYAF